MLSPVIDGGGKARDNSVQSVDRAISILQVLARRGVAGVTEISKELSVHKSTVSRLLGTLEARGLVDQATQRGRYRLGYGVTQLAEGASNKQDLTLISRPVCNDLAEDVGETVNVVVHEGRTVVTIDQVMGSSSITTVNWFGQRQTLHATSAGKVFLASMPQDELQTYLDEEMTRYTPHTIVDPAKLETELVSVREKGYARTMEEQEIGLVAVAAPIRALDGRVIAALAVSGPTFRIDETRISSIAKRLLSAAAEISERNGYPKAG
jgi:DNA-binding IclR family transcriptional regulator